MNFLAHIYLSGDHDMLKIGNFLGDFVKGKELEKYNEEIQLGIRLHRFIDYFTDSHEVVIESKLRLRPQFRHYAPVVCDMFYDHILARNWNQHHHLSLESYSLDFYHLMDHNRELLPADSRKMLTYMKRDNWLLHYSEIWGINRALTGMARRTKFDSNMEHASSELETNYTSYKAEFDAFFPDLQASAANFLKENAND